MPDSEVIVTRPSTPAEWEACFDLRWRVLRRPFGQPRGSERDELDAAADHVMACDGRGRLLGVGRVHVNPNGEARIRYMAVEDRCRGTGVGTALLERLESMARARGCARVVLNARDEAAGFYGRHGYRAVGRGPTMFGTLEHWRMEKTLAAGG